jgi:septum formation protein
LPGVVYEMGVERLILASASPQRHALLAEICPAFDVVTCPYPEPSLRSARVTARAWAQALAYFKARAVAERHLHRWVLGADTVVACGGRILGKPRDLEDAREMLVCQAREVGAVITGVCLLRRGTRPERHADVAVTKVWMHDDRALREEYLRSGDWVGKAGAYGIQTVGDRLVARLEGSFSNVVGLPLELLEPLLRARGLARTAGPGSSMAAG